MEGGPRSGHIAATVADLTDQMQCARAPPECVGIQHAQLLAVVVLQRTLADRVEGIETPDRLQFLAQVAEHELTRPSASTRWLWASLRAPMAKTAIVPSDAAMTANAADSHAMRWWRR